MKKIIFFLIALGISFCSFSQVIVNLTSVPCNNGLEGSYPFTYAGELDGSSTDWGCPNILLPQNAVAGLLEFIDDGTPGVVGDGIAPLGSNIGVPPLQNVPKGYLGCDTLGNPTQDLTGKIAVIYRGVCEFGYKALNAQKRGAIGVIIINHTGDPIGMGGGIYGHLVNIPVVMIGRIAGDDLFLALQSCALNSVTGFIGTKIGIFNNDMASSKSDILMTQEASMPQHLMSSSTPYYLMELGIWMYNLGANAQTGVTANVSVTKNGNVVYSQASVPIDFSAPDFSDSLNVIVDTQYVDLGSYMPNSNGYWEQGTYHVEYTINNMLDEDLSDNLFSFDFKVTEHTYSKSRIDVYDKPIYNTAYAVEETNFQYDNWEACIVLNKLNHNNIYWKYISGLTFSASPINGVMSDEIIGVKAYKWNDNFLDITSPPTFNSLVQIDDGFYFFSGNSDSLDNHFVSFNNYLSLENNQRYLFCVYNASDELRISYDKELNYKSTINHYQQPIAPLKTETDFNLVEWNWKGLGYSMTPAISVSISYLTNVDDENVNSDFIPYPNPTTNLLTVPLRKGVSGNVKVEVFDLTGKLVLSENQHIGNEPLKVNVASIKNGAYVFNLIFADGSKEVYKISVNR